jgi:hypothetical protein
MVDQYLGSGMCPTQLRLLAAHYANAALACENLPTKQKGLALTPYRLLAIHAIELALNALLLHNHISPPEIRGLRHNLDERFSIAQKFGLSLRAKTVLHIKEMTEKHEYLVLRYDIESSMKVSHLNRLQATLNEVSRKVCGLLDKPPVSPAPTKSPVANA